MLQGKAIAILQSNYIPWKGYFDIIASVDEFLLFDEVQYTRNDWRNRNRIVIQGAPHWLTIPVRKKGFGKAINEIETDGTSWAGSHWKTIGQSYARAKYFPYFSSVLGQAYSTAGTLTKLTEVNELFIRTISSLLGLSTTIMRAEQVPRRRASSPTERLVEICLARGASLYVSGPAARAYIELEKFQRAGIEVRYANYSGYPVYDQKSHLFEHGVSILDVMMHCGSVARGHLKSLANRGNFLSLP